jgi:hypothetical protein
MAVRHAAAVCSRGGAGIPSLRPARARLITAAGALAALGGVVAYAISTGGRLELVAGALGLGGLAALAVAIVLRWPAAIPWAVLAVGAAYLTGRERKPVVDGWAAVVGAALLVAAELAAWSIEHDARINAERALVVRRIATLAALLAAALLVNFILLGTAGLAASASVLLATVGVAAAVASVAVVLRLLRP